MEYWLSNWVMQRTSRLLLALLQETHWRSKSRSVWQDSSENENALIYGCRLTTETRENEGTVVVTQDMRK